MTSYTLDFKSLSQPQQIEVINNVEFDLPFQSYNIIILIITNEFDIYLRRVEHYDAIRLIQTKRGLYPNRNTP